MVHPLGHYGLFRLHGRIHCSTLGNKRSTPDRASAGSGPRSPRTTPVKRPDPLRSAPPGLPHLGPPGRCAHRIDTGSFIGALRETTRAAPGPSPVRGWSAPSVLRHLRSWAQDPRWLRTSPSPVRGWSAPSGLRHLRRRARCPRWIDTRPFAGGLGARAGSTPAASSVRPGKRPERHRHLRRFDPERSHVAPAPSPVPIESGTESYRHLGRFRSGRHPMSSGHFAGVGFARIGSGPAVSTVGWIRRRVRDRHDGRSRGSRPVALVVRHGRPGPGGRPALSARTTRRPRRDPVGVHAALEGGARHAEASGRLPLVG